MDGGKFKPGLTVYAGGEDTFCHRVVVTPAATAEPSVVAGQALTSGRISRLTDFEKPPRRRGCARVRPTRRARPPTSGS